MISLFTLLFFVAVSPITWAQENQLPERAEWDNQPYSTKVLKRLSSASGNLVYGFLEIPYQYREEAKRTDPVLGLFPGLAKGVAWTVAREAVGIFELLSFYHPSEPTLEKFDTEWLQA